MLRGAQGEEDLLLWPRATFSSQHTLDGSQPKWNRRALWRVGWILFCWARHVKEGFFKVDTDVKANADS